MRIDLYPANDRRKRDDKDRLIGWWAIDLPLDGHKLRALYRQARSEGCTILTVRRLICVALTAGRFRSRFVGR